MMADYSHRSVSKALLSLGALILILFACAAQYYDFPSSHGAITAKDHHVSQPALEPTIGKVALPFGKQGLLRHSFNENTTNVPQEEDPLKHVYGLRKRDLSWHDALATGQIFLDKLSGPRTETKWTTRNQLRDNGWTIYNPDADRETYYSEAYQALGIDPANGYEITAMQDKRFSNCYNEDNDPSNGYYTNTYNVPGKAIIGTYNYSPAHEIKELYEEEAEDPMFVVERLPLVTKWSQIVSIVWAERAETQVGSLKYVFKHDVVTAETKDIMKKAALLSDPEYAGQDPDTYPDDSFSRQWPGLVFRNGSPGFQALLGTPHGKGVAWLLVDHPDEFPGKDIESITMFTTTGIEDINEYSLLFTLTD